MTPRRGPGRPRHDDILTPAEWRIVHAVQHGLGNAEIAARGGVSRDAVKFHLANILGKLGLRHRFELRNRVLVPRTSALRGRASMEQKAGIGGLAQVSRMVGDIAAATVFYRDTLGLSHLYSFGDMAFFDLGGTRLYLHQSATAGPESVLYLRVGDIVAAHADLLSRGVRFSHGPHLVHRHADGTEEWMAFLLDPEERPLALVAMVPAAAPAAPS